jgi:hypothetical protein
MALIRCYECGKEISSLAAACPSCGAPPGGTVIPPPLPAQARPASQTRQVFWGTIALLTGVVLVMVIRGVTYQPNTPSVAASPTPATAESATRSSPSIQIASVSSPSPTAAETRIAESATRSSPGIQAASESSPTSITAETPIAEAGTGSSPIQTASEPSPTAAETAYGSDATVATATRARATYQVIGIPQGDYLNVREGAGSDYQVITRLEPGTGGILVGTKRIASGATTWQEITVHGQTGWVNAAYIAPETQLPASPTESSPAP